MLKSRLLFLVLYGCASTTARGETTLLDGNYFAFKPTRPFAVKQSGQWVVPRFTLSMGMEKSLTAPKEKVLPGYAFVLDATKAGIAVPEACQQRFSSAPNQDRTAMPMPTAFFDFGDVEPMFFFGDGCAVIIWMAGQRSYSGEERFEGSDIRPPQKDSVSHGLVEFRSGEEITLIQFAVPVEDLY